MFDNKYQEQDYVQLIDLMREQAGNAPCEQWPDAFHPNVGENDVIRSAKSLCQTCPVIKQCAEYGVKWENEGIYGGLTGNERAKLRGAARIAGAKIAVGLTVRTRGVTSTISDRLTH